MTTATSSSSSSSNSNDTTHLKLIPTRYLIPTDSVPMLSICGTDDGRIFMGGYDGCLYEMSYEGYVPSTMMSGVDTVRSSGGSGGRWYEDYDDDDYDDDGYFSSTTSSVMDTITSGSKRVLSTFLFGPSAPTTTTSSSSAPQNYQQQYMQRPRKCRKVNHSSVASQIVSAFVPGFVLNAASYVFGSNASSKEGGPIVKLTLDEERKTLYALTSKGFIHAFDLDTDANGSSSTGGGVGSGAGMTNGNRSHGHGMMKMKDCTPPPKLACTINVSKSVRKFLESVAHGKVYAPSMAVTDSTIAAIQFPGGGGAAQAGVGGMEGARSILKIADSEMMRKKQRRQAAASNRNGMETGRGRNAARNMVVGDGCLHPISIHVVPPSESKFLTLVAISTSGLRYYLSVLPDTASSFGNTSLKPGRRFSLCHVRAPPPLSMNSGDKLVINAATPMMSSDGMAISPLIQGKNGVLSCETKNACYMNGGTLLAISGDQSGIENASSSAQRRVIGDSIVVMTPDTTSKVNSDSSTNGLQFSSYADASTQMGGSGLGEVVSQPLQCIGYSNSGSTIMAGGHVWDIATKNGQMNDNVSSSLMNLYFKSSTPSDSILESEVVPPFIPPSLIGRRAKLFGTRTEHEADSSSFQAAQSATERKASKAQLGFFNGSVASLALNIFGSILFNKPVHVIRGMGQVPTYRISEQAGCKGGGFSNSALETNNYRRQSSSRSRSVESRRLQPSLLKPSTSPLPEMSLQHLTMKMREGFIALNSGGLHYFSRVSPADKLQGFLMESQASNIGRDENVKAFFSKYGNVESSALCLSIAIDGQANDKLARTAIQAALNLATRPSMVSKQSQTISTSTIVEVSSFSNEPRVEGYDFIPSSLHDGLMVLAARLLRPIWCKPAVVVTEGKFIQSKRHNQRPRIIPAKVELLLDEATLDSIRRPLARLQILMREKFQPAIITVPGSKTNINDTEMDTDDLDITSANLMMSAVQYHTQVSSQRQNLQKMRYSEKELLATAQLYEERSIHALYRIISRSVQLLTLMGHLYRAHNNPELPEVDFGYLHGKHCYPIASLHIIIFLF